MPTVDVPAQLTVEHLMAAIKQRSPAKRACSVQAIKHFPFAEGIIEIRTREVGPA